MVSILYTGNPEVRISQPKLFFRVYKRKLFYGSMTMNTVHSDELIAKLQSKDKKVVAILYDKYAPALYGIVLRLMKDKSSADDCLQEVFVRIWKNGHSYDPSRARLFTWMAVIARNTALNMIQSKSFREHSQIQKVENVVHIDTRKPVRQNPETMDLRGVVSQLDKKYADIIRLIYFEGYTQKEVSDELDIPLGTVKTRVKKAMGKLRSYYDISMEGIAIVAALLLTI